MNVNFSRPCFQGKLQLNLHKTPQEFVPLMELSINPLIEIKEIKSYRDDHLHFSLETEDKYMPSLKNYLTENNLSFNEIA